MTDPGVFRYRLYGLNIASTRAIEPADPADFDVPDLHVDWTVGAPPDLPWKPLRPAETYRRGDPQAFAAEVDGERLVMIRYYHDDRLFLIVNPRADRATIVRTELVGDADLASVFVGPIVGAILRLRHRLVLHAATVALDGHAIIFVGSSRSGKSTHAAALVQRGWQALADDLAAITPHGPHFHVESGYSRLRVRPGTAELLDAGYETSFAQVYSYRDSFYAPLGAAFHMGSLPLASIYLLVPGSGVRPLDPVRAVPELSRHMFANHVIGGGLRPAEFHLLCRIAGKLPVRTLGVGQDIAALDSQCRAVLDDLATLDADRRGGPGEAG